MNTKHSLIVITLFALSNAAAWADAPSEQAMKRSAKMATEVCAVCHGSAGRSEDSRFPKLAGQHAEYLENQLRNFKHHIRTEPDAHDFMWGVAATLDDELIAGLAYYFQTQAPSRGQPGGNAQQITLGGDIFNHGIPTRDVPACISCHGGKNANNGKFPRLAGQHAEYLLKQLHLIQNEVREVLDMHEAIKGLKPEEMEAIATYLHSI